jgi:hypothetical protein
MTIGYLVQTDKWQRKLMQTARDYNTLMDKTKLLRNQAGNYDSALPHEDDLEKLPSNLIG